MQKEVIVEAAAGVNENVQRLFEKGARRFLIMNLPPVRHAPIAVATLDRKERHQIDAFSVLSNRNLKQQLQRLERFEPSIDICEFNVHLLYRLATAAPTILGQVSFHRCHLTRFCSSASNAPSQTLLVTLLKNGSQEKAWHSIVEFRGHPRFHGVT
ncbi:MAG: hypothetical protein ACPGLY_09425 [Rubripirellula sp.]